jgi:hypothetical protein
MKKNSKYLSFRLSLLLCLCFNSFSIDAQILDVPYRNDMSCGNWCWAHCCQMIIEYYGDDIHLCEVLEIARSIDARFGDDNCCTAPDSCCFTGFLSNNGTILSNWSINSTYLTRNLSVSEVQFCLSDNRPFMIHLFRSDWSGGHTVLCYGIDDNDLFIHNPGNGTEIRDYSDLTVTPTLTVRSWRRTDRTDVPATNCLLIQNIIGRLNSTNSIYKAQNTISASCSIVDNSDIEFQSGGDVILEEGFEVQSGSSLLMNTGVTLTCP